MTTFHQLTARLKNFLMDWLLVLAMDNGYVMNAKNQFSRYLDNLERPFIYGSSLAESFYYVAYVGVVLY